MTIPDYQSIMLPLLKYANDSQEHSLREVVEALADEFNLSSDERKELLPSGQQAIFNNRVGWARTYLKKAGLLEYTKRGFFKVTNRGINILSQKPPKINVEYLSQFPEFIEFQTPKVKSNNINIKSEEISEDKTPEEYIELGYQKVSNDLEINLLNRVVTCSAEFFEKLVIDLLVKMGYGGSRKDAGERIGKSGDEGIDGIIKEDKLGLDIVYIQAKRWKNTVVGRPEIQKFAGALQGQRAKKGVFITTSTFSNNARDFSSKIDNKIVLIDGRELAKLMIDNNVGVSKVASYEIKKIDSDYFIDE